MSPQSFGSNTSGGANGTSNAVDAGARTGVVVTNRASGTTTSGVTALGAGGASGLAAGEIGHSLLTTDPATERPQSWSGWARGVHLRASADPKDGLAGLDIQTSGFAIGIDRAVTPDIEIGVAAGYSETDLDVDGRAGDDVDVRSLQLGVYSGWTPGPWFVRGAVIVGFNVAESVRQVTVGSLTGRPEADYASRELTVSLDGGRRFEVAGFGLEPAIGLTATHAWQDAYSEAGLGAVQVEKVTTLSVRPAVGLAIDHIFTTDTIRVVPQARVRYSHDVASNAETVTTRLVGASGGSLAVPARAAARDALSFGAGLAVTHDGLSVFADYAGEWRVDQTAHAMIAGLRYRW